MKKVLIISSTPRKKGNSELLCQKFMEGAEKSGNKVKLIRLSDKEINCCKACDACMKNGGECIQKDDMREILNLYKEADVLVLATPVYFYGISAQMKMFIDRTYPIWQNLGKKDIYYIVSAGLDRKIIERSLGDLDGFVEHLDEYNIRGRLYATEVMYEGLVLGKPIMDDAFEMGLTV